MANGRWEVAPQVDGVDSVDGVEAEGANGRVVYRVKKVKTHRSAEPCDHFSSQT
jgi:hypothetical protein